MNPLLPGLPFHSWTDTRKTLHLFLQVIGKVRMHLSPRKNHWWHITLYTDSRGFRTGPIPCHGGYESLDIVLDVHVHAVFILDSLGSEHVIDLESGLSVADFYHQLRGTLEDMGVPCDILARTYDVDPDARFEELTDMDTYDAEAVQKFWRIMHWSDLVFQEFSGRTCAKTSPVQLFWHHMDLAVTRFSGQPGAPMPESAKLADKEAYSHEVISFGFWAGDENVQFPAYYSYTAPSPEGLDQEPLEPAAASWQDANGSPMAILAWDDVRKAPDPRQALLAFLESAWLAGARRANWPIDDLTLAPLPGHAAD